MILRLGMHKGKHVSDVPTGYLEWLLRECDNLDWLLERAVEEELSRRSYRHRPQAVPNYPPPVDWGTVIRQWHRQLALRFHPDRGGSVEAMQVVNVTADRLKELVGV